MKTKTTQTKPKTDKEITDNMVAYLTARGIKFERKSN